MDFFPRFTPYNSKHQRNMVEKSSVVSGMFTTQLVIQCDVDMTFSKNRLKKTNKALQIYCKKQ